MRGAVSGSKQSQVEGSDLRWRGALSGGGERSQVDGGERSQEGSGLTWMGAIAGAEERSQVGGSDRW